jgi:hypothetical protein
MESPDELPNFRKFDARAALRTAAYALLSLACLLTSNLFGLVALVGIREARRRSIRRKLVTARLPTAGGAAQPAHHVFDSAPGRALLFEMVGLAVAALFVLGWYLFGPRLPWLP